MAGRGSRERSDRDWRHKLGALLVIFVVTRAVLTVVGLVSRELVPGPVWRPMPLGVAPLYSRFPFLDVWGAWDSSWYVSIARAGYQPYAMEGGFANYAFFPLYPLLSRWVGWFVGNVFIGGLIVANAALLVASALLYRLVALDDDEATAERTVKYLFAAPSAFFLSCMLTESLFLVLVVACFWFARTNRWWAVGVLGFLTALCRSLGVLVALPMLWIYLQSHGYSLRRLRPDVLWLAGFPAGLAVFMWFSRELTGDALAFSRIQTTVWRHYLQNPLSALWADISGVNPYSAFSAWYMLGVLVLSIALLWKLSGPYALLLLISVLLPVAYGPPFGSLIRYSVVAFPLYLAAARLTASRPGLDHAATIGAAVLQGFLMSHWANGSPLTI